MKYVNKLIFCSLTWFCKYEHTPLIIHGQTENWFFLNELKCLHVAVYILNDDNSEKEICFVRVISASTFCWIFELLKKCFAFTTNLVYFFSLVLRKFKCGVYALCWYTYVMYLRTYLAYIWIFTVVWVPELQG